MCVEETNFVVGCLMLCVVLCYLGVAMSTRASRDVRYDVACSMTPFLHYTVLVETSTSKKDIIFFIDIS